MDSNLRLRQILLLWGDIILLYLSLFITLFLRYGVRFWEALIEYHLQPFSIIFILWLFIFYITGLYELKILKNTLAFLKTFIAAIITNTLLIVIFFYSIPKFGITPKTNLFLFVVIFGILSFFWRRFFNHTLKKVPPVIRLLLIGNDAEYEELVKQIEKNPQLGYKVSFWLKNESEEELRQLKKIIVDNSINSLVLPLGFKKERHLAQIIFENISPDLEIMDVPKLYERIFQKIPISTLEEVWFIENITKGNKIIYELVKKVVEISFALIVGVIFLPLSIIIAGVIKLTSPGGPMIYRQTRVGRNGHKFTLYKFRTMIPDAEAEGPRWTIPSDPRITKIGKILRRAHLDEIPQLINLLQGNLALVGPRPERPEFVEELKKKIPYYEIRHLIKPGLTGWAQINYRYGASIEDAQEKLQYELYYLKNRDLVMDLSIILKTIKLFIYKL